MADSNLVLCLSGTTEGLSDFPVVTSLPVIQYRKKRYMAFYLDSVVEVAWSLFFIRWPMHASWLILALFLS
jgi:hypothetical protein